MGMATEQQKPTTTELEASFGQRIRACRIAADLDQASLASRSDVSIGALKNLENGKGSSLRTLIRVIRALDQTDWLDSLGPQITISPLQMLTSRQSTPAPRQRVSPRRQAGV